MSDLTINDVKNYLDVIHNADDDKLQMLLEAAEDEAIQIMDRTNLTDWGNTSCCNEPQSEPVSEIAMPASVRLAILILVQAAYQAGPGQMRHEAEQLREIAERKLWPYRCKIGI